MSYSKKGGGPVISVVESWNANRLVLGLMQPGSVAAYVDKLFHPEWMREFNVCHLRKVSELTQHLCHRMNPVGLALHVISPHPRVCEL